MNSEVSAFNKRSNNSKHQESHDTVQEYELAYTETDKLIGSGKNTSHESLLFNVSNQRMSTILYCLTMLINGGFIGAFGPSVESFSRTVHADKQMLSSTVMGNRIIKLIATISFGWYANKVAENAKGWMQPHVVIAWSIVMFIGSALLVCHATSASSIWLAMAVAGVSYGTADSACNLLILWTWHHQASAARSAISLAASFFTLGASLSPLAVAYSLKAHHNSSLAYLLLAALSAFISFGFFIVPSPQPPMEQTNQQAQQQEGPKAILMAFLVIVVTASVGAEHAIGTWLSAYAVDYLHTDEAIAAMVASGYWTAMCIGRISYVFVSSRAGSNWNMLLGSFTICLGSSLIMTNSGIQGLWIATTGLGFGVSAIFPCAMLLPKEHDITTTPRMMTTFLVCCALGEMVYPAVIGVAFQHKWYRVLDYMVIGSFVACLVAFLLASMALKISMPHSSQGLAVDEV